ncbi:MAG: bacillithiol biosynthesis BshC, partial [Ignavibacteria bacterium]
KNNIAQIDKTLIDSVEKNKQRLFQNLEILKEKVEKAQQNKYQITLNQLNKAKSLVFPNNNLQEREINILYYLNKYGLDFVKFLFSELKVNRFTHQIIEL